MNTRPERFRVATGTFALSALADVRAAAGLAGRVVERAQQLGDEVDHAQDLLLVPDVVARGHAVHPGVEDLVADVLGHAEAARGVLDVGDHVVHVVLLERPSAGPSAGCGGRGSPRRPRSAECSSRQAITSGVTARLVSAFLHREDLPWPRARSPGPRSRELHRRRDQFSSSSVSCSSERHRRGGPRTRSCGSSRRRIQLGAPRVEPDAVNLEPSLDRTRFAKP